MLNDPLFLIVGAAMLIVVVILIFGLGSFAKGGEFNKKHSNRLMRYRLIAQGVAIALIVVYVLIRRSGGAG